LEQIMFNGRTDAISVPASRMASLKAGGAAADVI
jgi:hypothetical protein